jgi:hypothetical protein
MVPVVEIDAGRRVSIVVLKGVDLTSDKDSKKDDK